MNVCVIGLGYIGLPTAAVLASKRVKVVGVDVNQLIVNSINKGEIHISEPELDILVREAVQNNYLKAVIKPEKADVFMVAVPTPIKGNYKPDLSYIKSAAKAIAKVLEKGNIVILESTSPVGTTEKMIKWMKEERYDLSFPELGNNLFRPDISVAYCPERVLPGHIVREIVENDRVIGGVTSYCAIQAKNIYNFFVDANCILTDCRTAELSKLVENSFRDVNVAFANELSLICDKLNINVWELIKLANHHPRVNILQPGPGVGGHCIAVDPWFIVDSVPEQAKLIRAARLVNDSKPNFVLDKIEEAANSTGKEKSKLKITCLGLSFKPDIDDLRESPAMIIVDNVISMGFSEVLLVEPNIAVIPKRYKDKLVDLCSTNEAIKVADIVVLLVDHAPFKSINLELLSGKQIVDTRGIWS